MNKKTLLVGWKEWAKLPALSIAMIKVKIDTGAKSSALHAHDIKILNREGQKDLVEFTVFPKIKNKKIFYKCCSEIIGMKIVKSSSGHKENRITIRSPIQIGNCIWDIDITLTDRAIMNYRMLIGREAMKNLLVDPTQSYLQGKF